MVQEQKVPMGKRREVGACRGWGREMHQLASVFKALSVHKWAVTLTTG